MTATLKNIRLFLLWYAGTLLGLLAFLAILVAVQTRSPAVAANTVAEALSQLAPAPLFWAMLALPYLTFLWIRSIVRGCRSNIVRAFAFRLVLPVAIIVGAFQALRWRATNEQFPYQWDMTALNLSGRSLDRFATDGRHRGAHVFGRGMGENEIAPLVENNFEWIVHVPFGWQGDHDTPELRFTAITGVEWSERDQRYIDRIEFARSRGMRNIVKPHIWLTDGKKWRSDIAMRSQDEWRAWFDDYRAFILHYARLAEVHGADAFCVGTELHETIAQRPQDWIDLIADVRGVFTGQLVYAANWNDPFEEIPFWDELDYIGIQAYFPLADTPTPDIRELEAGWQPYLDRLRALSTRYGKPVLFTELGYKSVRGAAVEPWQWPRFPQQFFEKVSMETQYNCYEAFFRTLWDEEWFAGVYIWQWSLHHDRAGGPGSATFTPQNKPAQNSIAKWFAR